MSTLRDFLELMDARLDLTGPESPEATEPAVLEDGCSVVGMAPAKGGLVGLDADTGSPMRVGWKYKTIDEKPVIINAGGKQTVIPPKPPPPKPPPPPPVSKANAAVLYEKLRTGGMMPPPPVDDAKRAFIEGCVANPGFYARLQARIEPVPPPEPPPGSWPAPGRTRRRVVDT